MKNNKIVGLLLAIVMLVSLACPVFASSITVNTDKSTYNFGDLVTVTTNQKLQIQITNPSNVLVLWDAIVKESGTSYAFSFRLAQAGADTDWPAGTYKITVGGSEKETTTFVVSDTVVVPTATPTPTSTPTPTATPTPKPTTKPTNGGSSSGSGSGTIWNPNLSTGVVSVLSNDQLIKLGITSGAVTYSSNMITSDSFRTSVLLNGSAQTTFTGYDPIVAKVNYTTGSTNTSNLVVTDDKDNVIPRSLFLNNQMIVAIKDTSSTFFIKEKTKSFTDVDQPWAIQAIGALAARDIINGVGDNLYAPNRSVTRAEFIKMIVTMFDINNTNATATFADVNSNNWFASYVATAENLGITNGYASDNTFRPYNIISRQEMSAMLYRASEVLSVKMVGNIAQTTFGDDSLIQSYAKVPVYSMQQAGVIKGVGDNSFDPQGSCTRAQAAVAIYNMFVLSMSK